MQRIPLRVHLVLAFVAFLFSLNYMEGKIAMRSIHPIAFVYLRVSLSALLLSILTARIHALRTPPLDSADRRSVVVYALLGVVFNQMLFLTGLSLTSAHHAAILITMIPAFTLIGAIALRMERATTRKIVGIAVAAAGALIVVAGSARRGESSSLLGDLLVLMNGSSYAMYLVISKPMMRRIAAARVVRDMFVWGAIILLPVCARWLIVQDWRDVPVRAWIALAIVVAGPTVAAYLLNAWALAKAESSLVAAYSYLQPVIASILAALFLGEVIRREILFAFAIIVFGVWTASGGSRVNESAAAASIGRENGEPAPGPQQRRTD